MTIYFCHMTDRLRTTNIAKKKPSTATIIINYKTIFLNGAVMDWFLQLSNKVAIERQMGGEEEVFIDKKKSCAL